jgi:hypothetical protein
MKYQLTIPDPCHQDWNKMTPTEKGKFCSVCSKEVVDLRLKSKVEIADLINNGGNLCGVFNEKQLNTWVLPSSKSKKVPLKWLVSMAAALPLTTPVVAQDTQTIQSEIRFSNDGIPINDHKVTDTVHIYGVVRDSKTSETIPFAAVQIGSREDLMTMTDFDGNFSFKVPFSTIQYEKAIQTTSMGYKTSVLPLDLDSSQREMTIQLVINAQECTITMGLVIIEKKPNVFNKIGDWFRPRESKLYHHSKK